MIILGRPLRTRDLQRQDYYTFDTARNERWVDSDRDGDFDYGLRDEGYGHWSTFDGFVWRDSNGDIVDNHRSASIETQSVLPDDHAAMLNLHTDSGWLLTNLLTHGMIAAIAAAGAVLASGWRDAPEGTMAIAAFVPPGTVGDRINVCLYPGAQPRELQLLNVSCREGADRCTATVALPKSEAQFIMPTYDLAQPPVAADHGSCDAMVFHPTGVLDH